jgi:hypothetical protein
LLVYFLFISHISFCHFLFLKVIVRVKLGLYDKTSEHDKSVNRLYRCPKVLGKPTHKDKTRPRYHVDVGTYSFL